MTRRQVDAPVADDQREAAPLRVGLLGAARPPIVILDVR